MSLTKTLISAEKIKLEISFKNILNEEVQWVLNLVVKFKYACLFNLFFRYFWRGRVPSPTPQKWEKERKNHTNTYTDSPINSSWKLNLTYRSTPCSGEGRFFEAMLKFPRGDQMSADSPRCSVPERCKGLQTGNKFALGV